MTLLLLLLLLLLLSCLTTRLSLTVLVTSWQLWAQMVSSSHVSSVSLACYNTQHLEHSRAAASRYVTQHEKALLSRPHKVLSPAGRPVAPCFECLPAYRVSILNADILMACC
jgi:hypothetical protein